MINYIMTISTVYPEYGVSMTDAYDYNTIDWYDEVPISQEQLDADWATIPAPV